MITVMFSCECGLTDCEVHVRDRPANEDVFHYMNAVLQEISAKHVLLAPLCMATKASMIKIPIDKEDPDGWIGKQTDIVPPRGVPSNDTIIAEIR